VAVAVARCAANIVDKPSPQGWLLDAHAQNPGAMARPEFHHFCGSTRFETLVSPSPLASTAGFAARRLRPKLIRK
jgi:hypothetical protein